MHQWLSIVKIVWTAAANFSGGKMPFSPPWTFNLSWLHVFDFSDGSTVTSDVHVHYQAGEQLDFRQANVTQISGGNRPT